MLRARDDSQISLNILYGSVSQVKRTSKQSEENSANDRSQTKCQLVQTSYIKRIKLFSSAPYDKHLKLTKTGRSVWESCMNTSHCVRSGSHDLSPDSPLQTSYSVDENLILIFQVSRKILNFPRKKFRMFVGRPALCSSKRYT